MSVRPRPSALSEREILYLERITIKDAELCSGSTGDFGSLSPGSNPGSAALFFCGIISGGALRQGSADSPVAQR